VSDEKVTASVRKRMAGGLTEQAAAEAVRFLEARASSAEPPGEPAADDGGDAPAGERKGAKRAA
jgi:hypothetical protein